VTKQPADAGGFWGDASGDLQRPENSRQSTDEAHIVSRADETGPFTGFFTGEGPERAIDELSDHPPTALYIAVLSFLDELRLPEAPTEGALSEHGRAIVVELHKILNGAAPGAAARETSEFDETKLLTLMDIVLSGAGKAGHRAVECIIEKGAPEGSSSLRCLHEIAASAQPPQGLTDRVTERLKRAGTDQPGMCCLVIAGAIALSAGVAVPLLADATAEIVLTNEIAIAALVVAIAALRGD
jgi:hypothetical protein